MTAADLLQAPTPDSPRALPDPHALALVLFRYFPFGGMQVNFLRIAKACLARGHRVDVYTLDWQGERPDGLNIQIIKTTKRQNISRYEQFSGRIAEIMRAQSYDLVMGFNRMPGLDLYYAADPCFVERVRKTRPWYYRFSARYRHFKTFEQALFGPVSSTHILALSPLQIEEYRRNYATAPDRFSLLPPGVQDRYRRSDDARRGRENKRQQLGIAKKKQLLLMVGSGFERKGFDRGLCAFAALPDDARMQSHIMIVGKGREKSLKRLAARLGIAHQLSLIPGSKEIPSFMQAADILLHPARSENTGNVIVEAICGGLPVLCSGSCGYAIHVEAANAGLAMNEPFDQSEMNKKLLTMLDPELQKQWSGNALAYAQKEDLYSRIEVIVACIERQAGASGACRI